MNEPEPHKLQGKAAFLVEDDALVGMTLKRSLEALGASVTWVTDVQSALAWLADRPRPDLAIVDINLSGHPSVPVLDALVEREIYIIISSGYDADALDARFQDITRCQKPFTRAKLYKALGDWLAGNSRSV